MFCRRRIQGIIHPATHGNAEGEIIVLDETAMFKKIFLYVDRCVRFLGCKFLNNQRTHVRN
jgi:5'-3' exonuclease